MTAVDPHAPVPEGRDHSDTGRITVSMRAETPRSVRESEGPVSPWLYIAGALVTLSALYAVNFGLEDSGFAMLTYVLAIGGYGVSYFLRLRGISLRGVQVPMLMLLGFFFLVSLLFGRSAGAGDTPSRNLQIALTWVAILHSYTLSNNAAVLFACVPGMTLIALVSTATSESEAQNAFLVFFCASTFLLIHENYLRTQAYTLRKSEKGRRPVLFGSQFALATGCFLGALLLARLTVVPLQFIGERVFPQGTINAIKGAVKNALPSSLSNNERTTYELASGPVSATETPVMTVVCDEPLYWRGGTFDFYTGNSFKNTLTPTTLVNQEPKPDRIAQYSQSTVDANAKPQVHFLLRPDSRDLREDEMTGSRLITQKFKVLGLSSQQLYGAGRIKELTSPALTIESDNVGALTSVVGVPGDAEYNVVSVVPTSDPEILKAAPSGPFPPAIAALYLQRAVDGQTNPVLAQYAAEWTQGKTNNYDKVLAIQSHIAALCSYNLNTPAAPRDVDIVEYFLKDSRQGYCDSFGAALTVMCRYAGIPARMTLGFLPGDETGTHKFLVKDKHRHIWTEVFFPHVGWVTFDATKDARDTTARTDAGPKNAASLLSWLGKQGTGPKVIELIVVVLLLYLVKTELIDRIKPRVAKQEIKVRARPAGNLTILAAYGAAVKQLARRGLIRGADMTTVEFDALVNTRIAGSEFGAALTELTELHDRYYYGMESAPPQEVQRAEDALHRLRESLRQFKGDPGKELGAQKSGAA